MVVEQPSSQQPTLGCLLRQLANELHSLILEYIKLFRFEIKEDAERITKITLVAFVGILLGFTTIIFFGFFIIFTLSIVFPLWISALIVTILYLILTILSVFWGQFYIKKLKKSIEHGVKESKKTMGEAKQWIHHHK